MIKCHLSRMMGERKLRIMDVARETGLHRNSVTLLYKETANRVDFEVMEKLCRYFNCEIGDMFQLIPDQPAIRDSGQRRDIQGR